MTGSNNMEKKKEKKKTPSEKFQNLIGKNGRYRCKLDFCRF